MIQQQFHPVPMPLNINNQYEIEDDGNTSQIDNSDITYYDNNVQIPPTFTMDTAHAPTNTNQIHARERFQAIPPHQSIHYEMNRERISHKSSQRNMYREELIERARHTQAHIHDHNL